MKNNNLNKHRWLKNKKKKNIEQNKSFYIFTELEKSEYLA